MRRATDNAARSAVVARATYVPQARQKASGDLLHNANHWLSLLSAYVLSVHLIVASQANPDKLGVSSY